MIALLANPSPDPDISCEIWTFITGVLNIFSKGHTPTINRIAMFCDGGGKYASQQRAGLRLKKSYRKTGTCHRTNLDKPDKHEKRVGGLRLTLWSTTLYYHTVVHTNTAEAEGYGRRAGRRPKVAIGSGGRGRADGRKQL